LPLLFTPTHKESTLLEALLLASNIIIGCKGIAVANIIVNYDMATIMAVQTFIVQTPEIDVINLLSEHQWPKYMYITLSPAVVLTK
jgi:hypothetical protein